jgi:hypothetical protein
MKALSLLLAAGCFAQAAPLTFDVASIKLSVPDEWTPAGVASGNAPPLFTALPGQLGLRLESQRTPVELLVVDRVEKSLEN